MRLQQPWRMAAERPQGLIHFELPIAGFTRSSDTRPNRNDINIVVASKAKLGELPVDRHLEVLVDSDRNDDGRPWRATALKFGYTGKRSGGWRRNARKDRSTSSCRRLCRRRQDAPKRIPRTNLTEAGISTQDASKFEDQKEFMRW
jgi:hypothetical protein